MKQLLINFYLEYVNNYLTIDSYAEFFELDNDTVLELLEIGKKLTKPNE